MKISISRLARMLFIAAMPGCSISTPAPTPSIEVGIEAFYAENFEEAKTVFKRLADDNHPAAQYYLALMEFDDNDAYAQKVSQHKYETALALLQRSVSSGYFEAAKRIGRHYENGWGVKSDAFMAEDWYRKGNELRPPPHGTPTFISLNDSKPTEISTDTVIEAAKKKALAGDLEAIYAMSEFYENNLFIKADLKEAFRWHQAGADLGSKGSQFQIAYRYCRGLGIEKNILRANELIKQFGLDGFCK